MESENTAQILDKDVDISFHANFVEKGINPFLLAPAMGK